MSLRRWMPEYDSVRDALSSVPRWVKYSALGVGLGLTAAGIMWYSDPPALVRLNMSVAMQKAGFTNKQLAGKVHTYHYSERGVLRSDQPSIVCIGGFSGCKEDWLLLTQMIQDDFHVVLLDLPGQGHSSLPPSSADTSIYAFRDMIKEFMQLTDLEVIPMHIVGISLGASLAALYTAQYPRHVDRLTLICPSIQCPIETEAWQEFALGNSTMVRSGTSNLNNSFYDPARKPQTNWKYRCLQTRDKSREEFQKKMRAKQFMELTEDSRKFEELLATIKVPTQIIWGENDEILHVSGASLLEELIPGVKRVDILEECGHDVHLEKPDQTRGLVMDFHNTTYCS